MPKPSYGQLQTAAIVIEAMPRALANQLKTFPVESQEYKRISEARLLLLAALRSIRDEMATAE